MNNVKVIGTIAMLGISGLSSLGSFIYSEYKNRKKMDDVMAKLQSSNEEYYKEKCEEQKKEDKRIREEANDILNDNQKAARFFNAKYDAMDENGHKVKSKTISPDETITLDIFDVAEDRTNLHISLIYKRINEKDYTYAELVAEKAKNCKIALKTDISNVAVILSIDKDGFISKIKQHVTDPNDLDDDNINDTAFERYCGEALIKGKYKAVNVHVCSNNLPLSERIDNYEDDYDDEDYEDDDYWEE